MQRSLSTHSIWEPLGEVVSLVNLVCFLFAFVLLLFVDVCNTIAYQKYPHVASLDGGAASGMGYV